MSGENGNFFYDLEQTTKSWAGIEEFYAIQITKVYVGSYKGSPAFKLNKATIHKISIEYKMPPLFLQSTTYVVTVQSSPRVFDISGVLQRDCIQWR